MDQWHDPTVGLMVHHNKYQTVVIAALGPGISAVTDYHWCKVDAAFLTIDKHRRLEN
jgi:hypothetical protein